MVPVGPVVLAAIVADRICLSVRVLGLGSLECVGIFVCVFGNGLLSCL